MHFPSNILLLCARSLFAIYPWELGFTLVHFSCLLPLLRVHRMTLLIWACNQALAVAQRLFPAAGEISKT
jgi:hypothetical protein